MIECNQCDEIVSHHHYLKFDDVTYYFCENCYFEYMDESEWKINIKTMEFQY